MKKLKVLSLFDGISVAQQALKELGFDVEYYASEIDKYAISITQKNHPNTVQMGDVKNIKALARTDGCLCVPTDMNNPEYVKIDLMIGGSPCQDLSIAKKNRQGLKGERSGLFYEYVRILKEVKPKYFVLENVNSMPKEAKQQITEIMGVEPIMINASLVSAQNRKRLFWTNIPNVTQPEDRGILLKDILEEEVDEKYFIKSDTKTKWIEKGLSKDGKAKAMSASLHKGIGTDGLTLVRIGQIGKGGQGDRIYSPEGKSVGLSALGGGRGAKTGLYMIQDKKVSVRKYPVDIETLRLVLQSHKNLTNKQIAKKLNQPQTLVEHWFRNDNSFAIPSEDIWFKLKELLNITTTEFDKSIMEWEERDGVFDQSKRVYMGDKTPTLQTGQQGDYLINQTIRKLTPIECERLQSMPDNYTDGISNSQRYKCLGNAFNKEVVKHILIFMA